jgi:hypothetical protein
MRLAAQTHRRHYFRDILAVAATVNLVACTIVTQRPNVPEVQSDFRIQGHLVDYKGNPSHLPATLVNIGAGSDDLPAFRYRTSIAYRASSLWQILNPLLVFGPQFLTSGASAHGTLEIIPAGGSGPETYDAACTVKVRQSLYSWGAPSASDLRRQALAGVKALIDAQLARDRARLTTKLGPGIDSTDSAEEEEKP